MVLMESHRKTVEYLYYEIRIENEINQSLLQLKQICCLRRLFKHYSAPVFYFQEALTLLCIVTKENVTWECFKWESKKEKKTALTSNIWLQSPL